MFKFTKEKEVVKEVIKEVEKIVVIGDSVVDVYQIQVPEFRSMRSTSNLKEYQNAEYHYESMYGDIKYKFFKTPDDAFAKAKGLPVLKKQAVVTSDNKIYLLDVRSIISLED